MRRRITPFILVILILSTLNIYSSADKDLFSAAKLALFDREWNKAVKSLDLIIKNHSKSKYYADALFYRARCFEELGKNRLALDEYLGFLEITEKKTYQEEALISVIDIYFKLYRETGEYRYIKNIYKYLRNRDIMISYYVAFKLSYLKKKKYTKPAVTILKRIVSEERDEELVNRAKIALMRIDPAYLKDLRKKKYEKKGTVLAINIINSVTGDETFSIRIPLSFAQLAMTSMPEKAKSILKKEGYDLSNIVEEIYKNGAVIKFKSNDTLFKLAIE